MTFGERVSLTRKKLKISQEKLAKEINTSAPVIGRYERNEIKPSVEVAAKIANTLGVTIDYLIGNSDSVAFDKRTLKRLEEIESLPEEDKEKLYYFIDMAIRDAKAKRAYSS